MNLDYNDEQNMLREQIQKFCESEYDFYKREEIVKSSNDFDENVWNLFAEQGWLSMPFSCLLYTSPSPRDAHESRMPSSA